MNDPFFANSVLSVSSMAGPSPAMNDCKVLPSGMGG
jgi:hypothetical protein